MTSGPIPDEWLYLNLEDVTSHVTDGTHMPPPRKNQGVPLLSAQDVADGHLRLAGSRFVDEKFFEAELRRTKLAEGDVLLTIVGSIGRSTVVTIKPRFALQRSVAVLKPRNVRSKYLSYFLRSPIAFDFYQERARGTAQSGMYLRDLKQLPVPVPPLRQQDLIVDAIQKIEAKRASALTHIANARIAMERFRLAVLAAACSGRLTADWRGLAAHQDMNDVLGERELGAERKTRRGVAPNAPIDAAIADLDLPATWARITVSKALVLEALVDVKDGNHGSNHPKVGEFTAEGVPFIAANLVHDGRIDFENAPRLSGPPLQRLRIGFAEPDDVILTHKGSVGRVAIADRPCVLTPQTTYYRCDPGLILPSYLAIYQESLYFYLQLAAEMSQTTRDFVPISDQYLLTLIIPPLDEQKEIVHRATGMLELADGLLARIEGASRRIERSSQAVLAKAFRGELIQTTAG